ncbi:MAG: glycosyltransferase family 4 protein [Planctomycetaceae bacterium]|nr:glycosyltransferase family 4 protein [Planctomycetaceae bacterium]
MTPRPLRILTVADVPPDPNSGAAGTVWHTNVALRELGHEVDEIWSDQLGPRRIRHGNLHALLEQPQAYRREVLKATQRRQYDVVQISQPQAYLAAQALRAADFRGVVVNRSHGVELRVNEVLPEWHRKLGVPESRFPRSVLTPLVRRLLERQWSKVVRYCDGVIVPSEDDRDCVLRRLRILDDRVRMIAHGAPDEYLKVPAQELTEPRLRRLLAVGQFAFFKAPQMISAVFNRVLNELPDCCATWVTSTAAIEEVHRLLAPAVINRVNVCGWGDQRDLINVYDEHGVFIFPSLVEGAGKASLEAMSRGMYVVASDSSAMRDYIRPGEHGCLAGVGDVDGFTSAVLHAIRNPQTARQVADRARRRSLEYSWSKCACLAVDFYQEILGKQRPANQRPAVDRIPAALEV